MSALPLFCSFIDALNVPAVMSSVSEEDDLPCLSPIEASGIIRTDPFSDHVGISFTQLVNDKKEEVRGAF